MSAWRPRLAKLATRILDARIRWGALACCIVFLAIVLPRITEPKGYVFDEIYQA